MLDALTQRLSSVVKTLRGHARLTELRKRLDELIGEAESRLAPTFRT